LDSLDLAVEASGFEIPKSRAEGYVIRLGLAYKYWHDLAKEKTDSR
jgi:hypothetical protein